MVKQSRLGSHKWCGKALLCSLPPFWTHRRGTFPTMKLGMSVKGEQRVMLVTLGPKYLKATLWFSTFFSLCRESGGIMNGGTSVRRCPWVGMLWSRDHCQYVRDIQCELEINLYCLRHCNVGGLFVTATKSSFWLIQLGPETWNPILGTTFIGNLNLTAEFWKRSFVVQKQIKEVKTNSFSLPPKGSFTWDPSSYT